jgi:hypothetical protein
LAESAATGPPIGLPNRASWLSALLLALGHVALLAPMRGPMIFGDEAAYLGMARFLIGRAPDLHLASPALHYGAYLSTGYSFALSPLFTLARDPGQAYRLALLFNAGLAAAAFLLLEMFARRSLGLNERTARLAALVASVHPVLALQPLIAWTEALLAVLLPALVLSFERLCDRPTVGRGLVTAGIAGMTYWAHQRTLGVLLVLLLGIVAFRDHLPLRTIGCTAAGCVAGLLAVRTINSGVWGHVSRFGLHPTERGIFSSLLTGDGLLQALFSAGGLLWYLSTSTLGLALLGAWTLWRRVRTSPAANRGAAATLLASAVLFTTSSAFVIIPDRIDKLFYGRYFEPALGLLLVAGMAAILEPPRWRVSAVIVASPMLLGLALLAVRGRGAFGGALNPYCVIGLAPAIAIAGRLRLLWTALCATAVSAPLLWLAHRRPLAAGRSLLLLFATASFVAYRGLVLRDNVLAQTSLQIPSRLRELPADAVVAYDEGGLVERGFFAYSYWIPPRRERYFDSATTRPPAELVIAGRSWPRASALGARLLFPENGQDQGLWVLPGRLQTQLAARGALFPADPHAPLPPGACRSQIELTAPVPRVPSGGTRTIEIRLRHAGGEAPWVSALALDGAAGAVRLGVRWYAGATPRSDQRVELPRSLAPGDEIPARLPLVARDDQRRPLPPGLYQVHIELVQELVRWFASVGDAARVVEVEVTRRGLVDAVRERLFDEPLAVEREL